MKAAPFDYAAPTEVDEALALLDEFADDAKVLAGGQSLVPLLALRMSRFDQLVDVNRIEALRGIERDGETLVIGAMTRQATIERDEQVRRHTPLLAEATRYIGHFQIRNRGTIGGSIAHADPTAEYPAIALTLGAEVEVASVRGRRRIDAGELLESAYTTTLEPEELLLSVRVPIWGGRSGFAVHEIARRTGDFALVGGAAAVTLDDVDAVARANVVLFGVADRAIRLRSLEEAIAGQRVDQLDLTELAREATAELRPPTDVQASGAYRHRVAAPLTERLLRTAFERARRAGDPTEEAAR
jgi:carbon-monoxide dehydrogenase medium subunit